jgi:hypothetical protein
VLLVTSSDRSAADLWRIDRKTAQIDTTGLLRADAGLGPMRALAVTCRKPALPMTQYQKAFAIACVRRSTAPLRG